MDVSDPVPKKFQRFELLRLARVIGRQDVEVLPDRRHDASRRAWAAPGVESIRISRQVHEFPDLPGARKLIGPLDRPMAVIVAAEKAAEEDAANPDAKTRYEMACHNLIYRMVVLIDAPKEVATK